MIKHIFVDLDDVLNTCTYAALEAAGCKLPIKYDPFFEWNAHDMANELLKYTRFPSRESFWNTFDESFWCNIPLSPEGLKILLLCEKAVGPENVTILTTPTDNPACLSGKLKWIRKNLLSRYSYQYLIGHGKWLCANPSTLLIDDRDENVASFLAADGEAILVPRPWNQLHFIENPLSYVTKRLETIMGFNT